MEKLLEFTIRGQTIQKKDFFEPLYKGTKGYLKCKFNFQDPWDDLTKIAVFHFNGEEEARYLDENDICNIPDAVADCNKFTVAACGIKDGFKVLTGETVIYLDY